MKNDNKLEYLIDAKPFDQMTAELAHLVGSIRDTFPEVTQLEVGIQRIGSGDSRGQEGHYIALVSFDDPRGKTPLELLTDKVKSAGYTPAEVFKSIQLQEILEVLANDVELDVENTPPHVLYMVIDKCYKLIDLGDWREKLAADIRTEFNLPIRGNVELSPAETILVLTNEEEEPLENDCD